MNLTFGVDGPTATAGPKLTFNTRPSTDPGGNPGQYFGEFTNTYNGTGGPRVIQLAVKFYF